ncbi:MAG: hypothetical protein IJ348_07705 [Alistipes sp.]|nr:hypothetical protein [Alistipes sp.]
MKKLFIVMLCLSVSALVVSANAQIRNEINQELEFARVETGATSGVEMVEDLSSDGLSIVKVAYKWFSGTAVADNKRIAIEMAQRDAYNTISRAVEQEVNQVADGYGSSCNGNTREAATSYWRQVSSSIIRGCAPLGDTNVEYIPSSGMYKVTAKMGMRGDRYNKMLDGAAQHRPAGLTPTELNVFMQISVAVVQNIKVVTR